MRKFIALFMAAMLSFAFVSCTFSEELSVTDNSSVYEEIVSQTQQEAAEDETEGNAEEGETTEEAAEEETETEPLKEEQTESQEPAIDEYGTYTTKDDVALYIHTYGKLPENFITKKEAQALGWPGGSLEPYAPGMCIGGSYFGNYEEILPEADGRDYYECDIDTLGASKRGAKRIVYSNDGLIYYTDDHYETFELLYGEE